MGMEYGKEQKETRTLENGEIRELMGMVFMSGKMATSMKENGWIL